MKKNYILGFMCLIASLLISNIVVGQTGIEKSPIQRTDKWQVLQQTDNILVEYKYADCNFPNNDVYNEEVLLRISNLHDKPVLVTWSFTQTYGSRCNNCDGKDPEFAHHITFNPKEVKEGVCGGDNAFRIFSKFLKMENKSILTDFKILNLKATDIR